MTRPTLSPAIVDVEALARSLPSSSKLAAMMRATSIDGSVALHPAAHRLLARVLVVQVPADAPAIDARIFAVCEEGFLQHRQLRIGYVDDQGSDSARRVEPHGLLVRRTGWLLVTLDHSRHRVASRTFRLDRIHRASLTSVRFEPRDPRTLERHADGLDGTPRRRTPE